MNITSTSTSLNAQVMPHALHDAVAKSMDRKRRLGQYAVTWHDGLPVPTGTDKPEFVQPPVGQPRPSNKPVQGE